MEVLTNRFESAVRHRREIKDNNELLFESKWQNSISGDEFVQRVHKHIDEIYARNKQ